MEAKPLDRELTDGEIVLRSPVTEDAAAILSGRDADSRRFLGEIPRSPNPAAVIVDKALTVVGLIDYDVEREWLREGEVNIGYHVFAQHRAHGFATRALVLLVEHLRDDRDFLAATLLIDPANVASVAVARRAGFERHGDIDGQLFFKLPARG